MQGEPRTTRDPSGRVTIVENDDRDTPFPIIQPGPANVAGVAAFAELVRIPMERARRGQLFLSGSVITTAAFTGQYVYIDLHVLGYIGAAPSVLFRTAMDSNQNLADFAWEDPETYSSLGIEARQVVDGAASGVTTGIQILTFTVAGTYWR